MVLVAMNTVCGKWGEHEGVALVRDQRHLTVQMVSVSEKGAANG